MMAMGVLFLAVAWFGARRGAVWAPWALLACAIVWIPYYFVIGADLARFGATGAGSYAWMTTIFAAPAVLGVVLLIVGTRRRAA